MTNDKSKIASRKTLQIKADIKKHSIMLFCILTFVISWTLWTISALCDNEILDIAGRFGPLVSAIIIVSITGGKEGMKRLFNGFFVKGVSVRWYLFSLLGPVCIILPAIFINQLITGIKPVYNDPNEWYLIIIAFFYVLFLSVLGEETGWRGFALPRLLKRFSGLTSGLIIGAVWGMWHLPLFLIQSDFHRMIPFWLFMIDNIALSVIMTWMYMNTKGSLLVAHLFHTASNVTLGILPILPMDTGGDMGALYIALTILIVITIFIVFNNRKHLCKKAKSHSNEVQKDNI